MFESFIFCMIVDNLEMGRCREIMAKFRQVAGIRQNIPTSRRNPAKVVSPTRAVEVVIEVFLFVLRCFINRKVCRVII